MSTGPSIADLLEQTNRNLAGTDARLYRRVAQHVQRTNAGLRELQERPTANQRNSNALLGTGSFLQQPVANLRRLCKEHGLKGYSKLPKAALAQLLEAHGVVPPPPPLERLSKQELVALVRLLIAQG